MSVFLIIPFMHSLIMFCQWNWPLGNWVYRDQLTKDDIKVYAAVLAKPGGAFPNASKWYDAVSSQLAARFVPCCPCSHPGFVYHNFVLHLLRHSVLYSLFSGLWLTCIDIKIFAFLFCFHLMYLNYFCLLFWLFWYFCNC